MQRFIAILLCSLLSSQSLAFAITAGGEQLSDFLDRLDVNSKWQSGDAIRWQSGEATLDKTKALNSHCAAFVAAAANRLGIYILRPPQHSEEHLASAQYQWLHNQSSQYDWFPIGDGTHAQQIANNGCLVVASYQSSNYRKGGHIAIVRPDDKSADELLEEGPEIIQAGVDNYEAEDLLDGFSYVMQSLDDPRLVYYGHDTRWCNHSLVQYVAKDQPLPKVD